MIDPAHRLSIVRQAQLLELSRSSVCYRRSRLRRRPGADATDRRVALEHPFAGSRMLRDLLRREGLEVGRKRVTTLMRKMGIEALYRKPRTSAGIASIWFFPTSCVG